MGQDDLIVPRLALPVGREVEIVLKSKDVLHNFFVPELRIKLDAVPGLEGRLRFTPDKTGTYEIPCSELCGLGHYRMRAFMEVMEPAAFETWLTEQAQYVQ
jgi:cytochrome c oxidase subunit 2